MITRTLTNLLIKYLKPGNVLALFGARRTGKTVIMQAIIDTLKDKQILLLNGEDMDVTALLSSRRQESLKTWWPDLIIYLLMSPKISRILEPARNFWLTHNPMLVFSLRVQHPLLCATKLENHLQGARRFFIFTPFQFQNLLRVFYQQYNNCPQC